MAKIVIYTTNYCGYCRRTKALLRLKNLPFDEINVEEDEAERKWLVKTTGQRTVPQIFINDKSIGGYAELVELEKSGELDNWINQNSKIKGQK